MKQKTTSTQARILQMLAWILSRFSMIVSRLSSFVFRVVRPTINNQRPTTQSSFVFCFSNNEQRTTKNVKKGVQTLFFVCALLLGSVQGWGQTTYTWADGTAPDGNWTRGVNNGPRWQPGNLW
ncbi:MAG: hypothetical protein ACK50E_05065, partial [Bacteroidota bacterium]